MKVLILTGGNSSERKISFLSARNVKIALKENGHRVDIYDLRKGYGSIRNFSKNYDILFPVLHGEEGEGGQLHKFLSKINKPIVGTRNYKGMEKAWYKIPFKKWCDKEGILTSPWKTIMNMRGVLSFGFPCVLKASNGGSSREVMMVKSQKDLKKPLAINIIKSGQAFVEKYISGTEITVGVLDSKALPVLEIIPKKDSWFSYKTKYDNTTIEVPFAPSVKKSLQIRAQKIALKIHNQFDLGTYSRTDFIVHGERVYVLEINTIPGITSDSLIPKQTKAAKINFSDFLEILLNDAK